MNEHYLLFDKEIDYYTGLQRYHRKILLDSVERLENLALEVVNHKYSISTKELFIELSIPFDKVFSSGSNIVELLRDSLSDAQLEAILNETKNTEEDNKYQNDELINISNKEAKIQNYNERESYSSLSKLERLQKSWLIASRILKNSDDIEDGSLKDRAFRSILISSLLSLGIYKDKVDSLLEKMKEQKNEMAYFYDFFSRFSLNINQSLLFNNMGTSKLRTVIKDYLDNPIYINDTSNIERFTAICLYIDTDGEDFKKYLNDFMAHNLTSSVKDFVFMKMSLLLAESNHAKEEQYYKEKINRLIIKAKEGEHPITKQKAITVNQRSQSNAKIREKIKQES